MFPNSPRVVIGTTITQRKELTSRNGTRANLTQDCISGTGSAATGLLKPNLAKQNQTFDVGAHMRI